MACIAYFPNVPIKFAKPNLWRETTQMMKMQDQENQLFMLMILNELKVTLKTSKKIKRKRNIHRVNEIWIYATP